MMTTEGIAYQRILERLHADGRQVRTIRPNQSLAQCPAHEDRNPSLSITQIEGQVLLHCFAGCHVDDILTALGLAARDLFDDRAGATYRYDDGRTVHRTWDKKFRQSGNLNGHQPSLFRLSRVQAAVAEGRTVWLVEGEKDVLALESVGEVATTAPMGAGNLSKCDFSPLKDAQLIAVPDRDESGLKWAQQAQRTVKPLTKSLDFMIAKTGKDAADHIAAGHTVDEFLPVPPPLAADPEEETDDLRLIPGGNFILDTDPVPQPIWGEGERVLWADGEALIIAGPQGAGKTTLAQQVALGHMGIDGFADLLGFPITPGGRLLYLAMDRPRQAARSFRRMVTEDQREQLNERLVVWKGPPPADLARNPSLLLSLCEAAQVQSVVVDSLKDAAIGLSDDDVGAGYNRARQTAIAAGIQVLELHHIRKAMGGGKVEHPTIDGIYGSTWITSGAGSVILLQGAPGDPIVTLHHLKQPAEEVGPYKVLHDDVSGRTTLWHETDLVGMAQVAGSISAADVAKVLYDTAKPTINEKHKAQRKLDRLVASGHLWVLDKGDPRSNRPTLWAAQ